MDQLLNNTCTVARPTRTNVSGVVQNTYREVGTYLCRLAEAGLGTGRLQNATQDVISDTRRLYTIGAAQIRKGDRVTVEGATYDVANLHPHRDHAGQIRYLTCLLTPHA